MKNTPRTNSYMFSDISVEKPNGEKYTWYF